MNEINIVTAQNVTLRIELANVGDRFLAAILDVLLKIGITIAFSMFTALLSLPSSATGVVMVVEFALVWGFYSLIFETLMHGQTPGKRMMKIKVARMDGEQVTFSNNLLRWLFRIVDFPLNWPAIGIFTISSTEKHQRLGDLVAGTILVSTKERTRIENTFYTETKVGYVTAFPEATRLTTKEAEIIKEVLRLYHEKDKYDLVQLTAQKVKELLQVTPTMDDLAFLKIVLQDFNYAGSGGEVASREERFGGVENDGVSYSGRQQGWAQDN
jgi:uncharacterized RDD family membrane protein YckC